MFPAIANQPLYVTWLGLLANLALALLKGVAGIFSNSAAMIADAGHSFSDLLSDLIALWALRMAQTPKDQNHPYGHGKFETIGALFLALMLIATGIGIAIHAIEQVDQREVPGNLALAVAIASILFKEALYRITSYIGERNHSRMLIANAWHHRSDAISSLVALIGIGGAQWGFPLLDPIAGILVAGWIVKIGLTIGYNSVRELSDEVVEEDILPALKQALNQIEGVEKFHDLRTRRMGSYVLVDLHVQVDSRLSVSAGHQIGERVRMMLLEQIPQVNEVLVHIDAEEDLDESHPTLMRPQSDIESDIRQILQTIPEIKGISHILCHFLKEQLSVQIEIMVDPRLRVYEVQIIARKARRLVEEINDIQTADIHLELDDL